MKVLILAGGFATRLWPISQTCAKPLLLLGGKTILGHLLEKIPKNFETIILTNRKFAPDFQKILTEIPDRKIRIFCEDAEKDAEKKGAIGAVSAAISHFEITENIFIFAGDNYLPNLQINDLIGSEKTAKIAVKKVDSLAAARHFGVVQTQKSRVISFFEKPEKPLSQTVSTGFSFVGADLFPVLHRFADQNPDSLGGVFSEFLRQNVPVFATEIKGDWFDIGSFQSYLDAHKSIQKTTLAGENFFQKNTLFAGKVSVGKNCQIVNCRLSNCIIYPDTKLENCFVSESVVAQNCHLRGVDLCQKIVGQRTELLA